MWISFRPAFTQNLVFLPILVLPFTKGQRGVQPLFFYSCLDDDVDRIIRRAPCLALLAFPAAAATLVLHYSAARRVGTKAAHYRVTHLLKDLGCVDMDWLAAQPP